VNTDPHPFAVFPYTSARACAARAASNCFRDQSLQCTLYHALRFDPIKASNDYTTYGSTSPEDSAAILDSQSSSNTNKMASSKLVRATLIRSSPMRKSKPNSSYLTTGSSRPCIANRRSIAPCSSLGHLAGDGARDARPGYARSGDKRVMLHDTKGIDMARLLRRSRECRGIP